MRTIVAALICCLLVAALSGAAVVSGASSTSSGTPIAAPETGSPVSETPSSFPAVGGVDASPLASRQTDQLGNGTSPTAIEVTIQPDGDARFVLVKKVPAGTEAERAAFQRLATEFENGEYGYLGYATIQSVVDEVAAETGREMRLTDAGPHTTRSDAIGRLEYRFTWTNFATSNEENVTVGDAFHTGESLWLDRLESSQQLIVRAPEGYGVAESPSGPQIDEEALIWTGPTTFQAGDLQVTFEESASGSTFPTTAVLVLVVLAVVVLLLVAGWRIASGRSSDRTIGDRVGSLLATNGAGADATGSRSPDDEGAVTAQTSGEEEATTVADSTPSAAADAKGSSDPEAVDSELLSDEERVEQLLEENGGRMKQANIVTETGWSNAKVSQLLSGMAEEERVDKLRIGRENLITLPDVDVTDQE